MWEDKVTLNIAESGLDPLSTSELVDAPATLERVLRTALAYPPTRGTGELRARIAALYPGAGADNVLVTTGCAEANFLIAWSLLEPGDKVVFLQPNYMQIAGLARGLGARVKPFWLREPLGWQPEPDELDRLVTLRTKLVAICNPNNPTGAVLPEATVGRIAAAAAKVGAYLLADEVYRGAELDGPMSPTFWDAASGCCAPADSRSPTACRGCASDGLSPSRRWWRSSGPITITRASARRC